MSRCYINRISSIFRRRRGRSQIARHMAVPPGLFRPHPSSTAQADISYWRMVRLDSDMTREEGRLAAGNFAWVATQHLEWAKPQAARVPRVPEFMVTALVWRKCPKTQNQQNFLSIYPGVSFGRAAPYPKRTPSHSPASPFHHNQIFFNYSSTSFASQAVNHLQAEQSLQAK
jgi:hypothetical protein